MESIKGARITRRRTGVSSPPRMENSDAMRKHRPNNKEEPETKKQKPVINIISVANAGNYIGPLTPPMTPFTVIPSTSFGTAASIEKPNKDTVTGDDVSVVMDIDTQTLEVKESPSELVGPVRTPGQKKEFTDSAQTKQEVAPPKKKKSKKSKKSKKKKKEPSTAESRNKKKLARAAKNHLKIIIEPIKFPLQNKIGGKDELPLSPIINTRVDSPVPVIEPESEKQIEQTDLILEDKMSQCNILTFQINVDMGTQTSEETKVTAKIDVGTQNLESRETKVHAGTQTEGVIETLEHASIQRVEEIEISKIDASSQTDELVKTTGVDAAVQTITLVGMIVGNGRKYMPYEPIGITGTLVGKHIIYHKYYETIEVVRVDERYRQSKIFPTHWLGFNNPYWIDGTSPDFLATFNVTGHFKSSYDKEICEVVVEPSGRILATRDLVTVVIQYPDGGTGNIYQHPKLDVVNRKPPIGQDCVPTEFIPVDCPYWHNLMGTLTFKPTGYTRIQRSPDDNIQCAVHILADGAVEVTRDGVRVRLREAQE